MSIKQTAIKSSIYKIIINEENITYEEVEPIIKITVKAVNCCRIIAI